MTAQRFKDKTMQRIYDTMLALAADKQSELYWKGEPRRGGSHRCAFWDGYSGKFATTGKNRSPHVIPGTMGHACFAAGREHARREKHN